MSHLFFTFYEKTLLLNTFIFGGSRMIFTRLSNNGSCLVRKWTSVALKLISDENKKRLRHLCLKRFFVQPHMMLDQESSINAFQCTICLREQTMLTEGILISEYKRAGEWAAIEDLGIFLRRGKKSQYTSVLELKKTGTPCCWRQFSSSRPTSRSLNLSGS